LPTTFVAEKPEHRNGIDAVLDRAFGPGRFAKTSERVRERGARPEPGLSRIGLDENGAIVGVCRISSVEAGAPLFFLGPLAVDPGAQSAGLGAALVREAVIACRARGGAAVVLVGAHKFFQPLGFSIIPPGRLLMPGPVDPERFLWAELRPGGVEKLHGEIKAPAR
jgi:predicted N-acetyltransferase YhbS